MIDRTLLRLALFILIYGARLLTSYILLQKNGQQDFEAVFKIVSILSLTSVLFLGFPTGSKTEALNIKKSGGDISYAVFVLNTLNFILLSTFMLVAAFNIYWSIAAVIFVSRLAVTFEEVKRELLDYRYVARFSLLVEVILICVFLSGLSTWVIFGAGIAYYGVVVVRGFNRQALALARDFLNRSIGIRTASLEFSSILLFGLDVFWASVFMSSEQFVAYFFIARIFSGMSVLFGGLTRNYWAQGYLAETQTARRMVLESFVLASLLTLAAFIAVIVLLFAHEIFIPEAIAEQIPHISIIELVIFQFILFCFQVYNRLQKNNLLVLNRVLDVASVNFICGLVLSFFFLIGWMFLQENMIVFFIAKIIVFGALTVVQARIAQTVR